MGEKETIIFLVALGLLIIFFVVIITIFALKWEKKKKEELIARCTASVQGILAGIAQSSSHSHSNDGYDHYRYDPIVHYEFHGQTYEKTHSSTSSWEGAKPGRSLTIFVNPDNPDEIYVPYPEDLKEIKKIEAKKMKVFLVIFFVICFSILIFCILTDR